MNIIVVKLTISMYVSPSRRAIATDENNKKSSRRRYEHMSSRVHYKSLKRDLGNFARVHCEHLQSSLSKLCDSAFQATRLTNSVSELTTQIMAYLCANLVKLSSALLGHMHK